MYNLRIQILSAKKQRNLIKSFSFREFQVLMELIFQHFFQFNIFALKESSKQYLIFSYFSVVFEKSANLPPQDLSLNLISTI